MRLNLKRPPFTGPIFSFFALVGFGGLGFAIIFIQDYFVSATTATFGRAIVWDDEKSVGSFIEKPTSLHDVETLIILSNESPTDKSVTVEAGSPSRILLARNDYHKPALVRDRANGSVSPRLRIDGLLLPAFSNPTLLLSPKTDLDLEPTAVQLLRDGKPLHRTWLVSPAWFVWMLGLAFSAGLYIGCQMPFAYPYILGALNFFRKAA